MIKRVRSELNANTNGLQIIANADKCRRILTPNYLNFLLLWAITDETTAAITDGTTSLLPSLPIFAKQVSNGNQDYYNDGSSQVWQYIIALNHFCELGVWKT